jgi:hypothetical protein
MKYKVQWNYRSGLAGPWMAGDEPEVEPELAEAINRDSPGVLVPVVERKKLQRPDPRGVETLTGKEAEQAAEQTKPKSYKRG